MIEIVCPSCQARYQLPDGSIGSDGRKVSCSSCSHKWRAFPEGAERAAEQAADPAPAPAAPSAPHVAPVAVADEAAPARVPANKPAAVDEAAAMAAVAVGPTAAASSPAPPPAGGDREEQMAAIRQMLSDLKEGVEEAPAPEVGAKPVETNPAPATRRRADDDEEERDSLKSRIDELSKLGKAAKGEAGKSGYDAARLRKLHEKRAKKLQKSRERKKRSGAFVTGFTLVAVVTATLVGLYVMKPQIVEASPKMAPAMTQYVVTVDRYRIELNEKTAEWRAWLTERIAGLTKEDEKG